MNGLTLQPRNGSAAARSKFCTINITPSDLREDYLLYKRDRFIMNEERILTAIAEERLEVSRESLAEFYETRPAESLPAASQLVC